MKERNDLLTGEPFIPKRINQRFVRPENRIMYHNQRANNLRHTLSRTNNPLLKNYKILIGLLGSKKQLEVHRQFLLGMGYTFSVFTNYDKHNGNNQISVYGIIIIPEQNQLIKIIQT